MHEALCCLYVSTSFSCLSDKVGVVMVKAKAPTQTALITRAVMLTLVVSLPSYLHGIRRGYNLYKGQE